METKYKNTRFLNNINKIRFDGVGEYNIPIIKPEQYTKCDWIGFNYAKSCRNRINKGIHFYLDDFQFERIWTCIDRYSEMFLGYLAIMSPDFSMYADWPKALNIWNHYRKHYIAAYCQNIGITVYPSISWCNKESLNWCFDGEPVGSCVSVSSVGTQIQKDKRDGFLYGYDAMLERLRPDTILFYGNVPKECRGNIVHIEPFQSKHRFINKNIEYSETRW